MTDSKDDIRQKMESAFHDGTITELKPEEWDAFLKHLCAHSTSVVSGVLDPREINRATLLSLLKNFHLINKIEKSNQRMAFIAITVGILALLVSSYSIYSTWHVASNIERIAISTEELNKNTLQLIKLESSASTKAPNKSPNLTGAENAPPS